MCRRTLFNALRMLFTLRKRKFPKNPRKILLIRMGGIGDVLMSTPLVKNIRLNFPAAKIHYLVGNWARVALDGNHDVDKITPFDEGIILKRKFGRIIGLRNMLKKEKYDVCFILDKHWFFALFAFFAGMPFRVGFDRYGEGFCNNINVEYGGERYELEYYLSLARKCGMQIHNVDMVVSEDKDYPKKVLKNWNKTVTILPGAATNPGQTILAKRWPRERYIELGKRLLGKGYKVILMGAQGDAKICEYIELRLSSKKVINLAGISFGRQIAVMRKSSYVVTHDSGPMHMAAAAGAKLIAIFGPTDPERFAPKNAIAITKKPKAVKCYDVYGHYDRKCDDWTSRIIAEDVMRHIR